MKISLRNSTRMDILLLVAVFLLVLIGLLSIYSVGLSDPSTKMIFFNRQLILAISGIAILLAMSFTDYRFLKSYYKLFIVVTFIFLGFVLITGRIINGASAWLQIFGFQFQPVELGKIALIIFLATYLSKHAKECIYSWKPIIVSAVVSFSMMAFVALQPDLGSALILFAIWLVMILFTKIDKKKIITIFLLILVLLASGWFGFFKDYQKNRILTFLDPERDPLGSGYNLTQSITAVGSGKIAGRGFGLGSQSQLNFLPEQRTDFIFAVISEEFGFFGSIITISLLLVILLRIAFITKSTNDNFAIFMAIGFFTMFFSQSFLNIAMNIGIAPVIGIPLPFVSYGGSSIWTSLFAIGVLESITLHRVEYF